MVEYFIKKVKLMSSKVKIILNVNLENIIKIPSSKKSEVTITPNIASLFVGWGGLLNIFIEKTFDKGKIVGVTCCQGMLSKK
jgi:hypothetical protein